MYLYKSEYGKQKTNIVYYSKLEDAIRHAFIDYDSDEVCPLEIIDEKGNIVIDKYDLFKKFKKHIKDNKE